jgi:hypothetical protein
LSDASNKRNLAADIFRGLGLWILFIDHLEPNFWSHFTPGQFGFSDFAEIFVFFSGYINAGMYERAFASGGVRAALHKLRGRIFRLYAAHILTMVASVALLAFFAARGLRIADNTLYLWMRNPPEYAVRTLALFYAPHWYSLLPLYIVLAPFTVLAIYSLRRRPLFTLSLSFLVWCVAQFPFTDLAVMTRQEAWFFRPLAWQWIMVLGAASAMHSDRVMVVVQSIWLRLAAAAIVVGTALLKIASLAQIHLIQSSALLGRLVAHDSGKARLAPFRLIHFLCLAILIAAIPWDQDKLRKSRFLTMAAMLGRNSLPVYCVTLILMILGNLNLEKAPSGPLIKLVCCAVGLAIMTAIGFFASRTDYNRNSLEKDQRCS